LAGRVLDRKTIIISATSDLVTDQRVHRTAITFTKQSHRVVLVGRKLKGSLPTGSRRYRTHRFRLGFEKGFLFYAAYNIRLFFYLLTHRADLLFANDLDTLPANYLASLLKRVPLVYDSHEYFTGVPELAHNAFARKFWLAVERLIFPRLEYVITVNPSIAALYEKKYGKPVHVIYNIPDMPLLPADETRRKVRQALQLPPATRLVILQGAGINVDRGAEEAVLAMARVPDALLLIIGGGDVFPALQALVQQHRLEEKVRLMNKMPFDQLIRYTIAADLGLTLDKPESDNYRYSLPNKLFDYIHARIPVLASPVPEVKRIVETYDIGLLIDNHDPRHIADRIAGALGDESRRARWRANLDRAAQELNWSAEEKKLLTILHEVV
jgi:glycosyltransferase involved in cell wall biosynthesis